MSKNLISYKMQYYLSLIPFVGLFIAWITSWINIWRKTKDKKYIFLHYIIWILPLCIAGGFIAVCALTFMSNLPQPGYTICALLVSYVACLMMSLSCIAISKVLISKFDLKFVNN